VLGLHLLQFGLEPACTEVHGGAHTRSFRYLPCIRFSFIDYDLDSYIIGFGLLVYLFYLL